jgi:hypothetical protein
VNTRDVKQDQQFQGDGISFKELIYKCSSWVKYISSFWKKILLYAFIGGCFGYVYAYRQKPIYFAKCTFVLEEEGGGGLSQYAGIASMVGIDLSGRSSNGIFQGENIFELYKSRLMIERALLSSMDLKGKKTLLIDRYIESNNLREKWSKKPGLKSLSFSLPKQKFTLTHDSILGIVVKDINKNYLIVDKLDRNLSIISVRVKSEDEIFAKNFTDKIVENVNEFYINTKTKNSLETVQLLQKQADSVKRVLNSSISGTASAIDVNPNANTALQILRVPSQRRQIDVQANSAIYSEVVKNLEIAKISFRKEKPLIQVIDVPIYPLERERLGKLKSAILGGGITVFLTLLFLTLRKLYLSVIE